MLKDDSQNNVAGPVITLSESHPGSHLYFAGRCRVFSVFLKINFSNEEIIFIAMAKILKKIQSSSNSKEGEARSSICDNVTRRQKFSITFELYFDI